MGTKRKRGSGKALAIPDRAIGVYFALFPVAVAAFLSVQAVRAQSEERHSPIRPALMDVAR